MSCMVCEVMTKHENYARGWVRLYPNDPQSVEMAQYSLDLQKLRHAHEERCESCVKEAK